VKRKYNNVPLKAHKGEFNGVHTAVENTNFLDKWAIVLILFVTALLYFKAIFYDFVILDDDIYVVENHLIKNFSIQGIKTIFSVFWAGFYQPLILLVYMIQYALFGLDPMPYHLLNIILHLFNIYLVYRIAGQLSKKRLTAYIVAILFAIHPMRVESVVWVTELKDMLYTFFFLLAFLSYLRYLNTNYLKKHLLFVLLFFLLALLSKAAAVTLPVLLLATDLYLKRKMSRSVFFEKIPLFILSLVFGVLAVISQSEAGAVADNIDYYGYVNTFFLSVYALAFYLVKLIAPFSLSAMHYFPKLANELLPWYYYAALPFLLFVAWLVLRKHSLRRETLFGFSFFLIAISVMLQIIPVGMTVTMERFTYVPYIGLFYLTGQYLSHLHKRNAKLFAGIVFSIFVMMFIFLTWNRIPVWKNAETLISDVLLKYPDYEHSHYGAAIVRERNNDLQGALKHYNRSIEINNQFYDAFNDRGVLWFKLGNLKFALDDYNKALEINPEYVGSYINRGWIYYEYEEYGSAMNDYNKALSIESKSAQALFNRGVLKHILGMRREALLDVNKAIYYDSDNPGYYFIRAYMREVAGNIQGSIEDRKQGSKYGNEEHIVFEIRSVMKNKSGDLLGALDDLNNYIKLKSDNARAYNIRGNLFADLGKISEAIADYNTAIELDSVFADAYNNRSIWKTNNNDLHGAMHDINKAIALDSMNANYLCTRGFIKAYAKNYKEAIEDYNAALKFNHLFSKAFLYRGIAFLNINDLHNGCRDLQNGSNLGNVDARELLESYCR